MLGEEFSNCLERIIFGFRKLLHLKTSISDANESAAEATMAQRKVILTQTEYEFIIQKWPLANPAMVKISKPKTDIFYETEVRIISKIDGISQECIEYIRDLKKGKKSAGSKNASNLVAEKNTQKREDAASPHNQNVLEYDKTAKTIEVYTPIRDTLQDVFLSPTSYYYLDPPRLSRDEYPSESKDWNWIGISDYVVGFSHLKSSPSIPCQDTALATILERPILIVSDGAGSCKLSHFGSNAVVSKLSHFISEQKSQFGKDILDSSQPSYSDSEIIGYAKDIIDCSIQILRDEAVSKKDTLSNFKCTLSIVVAGRKRSFWLRVGDSPLIVQETNSIYLLGSTNKGEFTNQTNFICEGITEEEIQYGLVCMDNVRGFCGLSDGAAEKLISTDGRQIASAISKILDSCRIGELTYQDLHDFLSNSEFWFRTTGDDKSLAALVIQN